MRTLREAGTEGLWKSAVSVSGQYPFLKVGSELLDRFGDQKVDRKYPLVLGTGLATQLFRTLTYYIEGLMKAEHCGSNL